MERISKQLNNDANQQDLSVDGFGPLARTAHVAFRQYITTQDKQYLDQAITLAARWVQKASREGNVLLATGLINLSRYLEARYKFTKASRDFDGAVAALYKAMPLIHGNAKQRQDILYIHACLFADRYIATNNTSDIAEAIRLGRGAVVANSSNDLDKYAILSSLARWQMLYYDVSNQLSTLSDAIMSLQQAIELAPANSMPKYNQLINLALWFELRYQRTVQTSDLEGAIEATRTTLSVIQKGEKDWLSVVDCLGRYLSMLYQATERDEFLEEAISLGHETITATEGGHPNRVAMLLNLASRLELRFDMSGRMDDVNKAIELTKTAMGMIRKEDDEYPEVLEALSDKLQTRYIQTEAIEDLEEAIRLANEAVTYCAAGNERLPIRLCNLGNKLTLKFEVTSNLEDLNDAVSKLQEAVALMPDQSSDSSILIANLSRALCLRYEYTDQREDLQEGLLLAKSALEVTKKGHIHWSANQHGFGSAALLWFELTGDVDYLEAAIEATGVAIQYTPKQSPELASRLDTHGNALENRYVYYGRMDDLNTAIKIAKQALSLAETDADDPARGSILNSLADKLRQKYMRTWDMDTLNEAVQMARQAVSSVDDEQHPDLGIYCNTLGVQLHTLYLLHDDINYLEEAIQCHRKALDRLAENHTGRIICLDRLCICLDSLYLRTKERVIIEEAIRIMRGVVARTAEEHSLYISRLNTLALLLEDYEQHSLGIELDEFSEAYQTRLASWQCANPSPFERIFIASHILKYYAHASGVLLDQGIDIGKTALHLLPVVYSPKLTWSDRQHIVEEFRGIASMLCSLLLLAGRPDEAVLYLEQGRNIIMNSTLKGTSEKQDNIHEKLPPMRFRSELSRHIINQGSRSYSGGLNQKDGISEEDNEPPPPDAARAGGDDHSNRVNIEVAAGEKSTIPVMSMLQLSDSLPGVGYIVIINISSIRGDAIILSHGSEAKAIHLSKLKPSEATAWIKKSWRTYGFSDQIQKNKDFMQYLKWLWEVCVLQVLEHLPLPLLQLPTSSAYKKLPRVWWIGAGIAASMPFHAAGIHETGSKEYAMDRVISSYASSISSLARARLWDDNNVHGLQMKKMLTVTMSTTPAAKPGGKPLRSMPRVIEERDNIIQQAKGCLEFVNLTQPSVQQVLEALPKVDIAHFACHGITNGFDPSESSLVLEKPDQATGAVYQDRLTVIRAVELDLKRPWLAFLSACSTAQSRVDELSEESIHVVSGFQLAGIPHVVGCLWPSDDSACVQVSKTFYNVVLDVVKLQGAEDSMKSDTSVVAYALRTAVLSAREGAIKRPLSWAPFVHYGT